eukprot:TRINITY_DN10306_c4_g1_i1.p1 TRINITY_DN10306_c4_g1~~TRINITY_DN10306_c4_g1_i1.p1  ORF type:complete len:450 (+),score=106.82 TRINITY_DN10306_c4_g1_i1:27-1352(+)
MEEALEALLSAANSSSSSSSSTRPTSSSRNRRAATTTPVTPPPPPPPASTTPDLSSSSAPQLIFTSAVEEKRKRARDASSAQFVRFDDADTILAAPRAKRPHTTEINPVDVDDCNIIDLDASDDEDGAHVSPPLSSLSAAPVRQVIPNKGPMSTETYSLVFSAHTQAYIKAKQTTCLKKNFRVKASSVEDFRSQIFDMFKDYLEGYFDDEGLPVQASDDLTAKTMLKYNNHILIGTKSSPGKLLRDIESKYLKKIQSQQSDEYGSVSEDELARSTVICSWQVKIFQYGNIPKSDYSRFAFGLPDWSAITPKVVDRLKAKFERDMLLENRDWTIWAQQLIISNPTEMGTEEGRIQIVSQLQTHPDNIQPRSDADTSQEFWQRALSEVLPAYKTTCERYRAQLESITNQASVMIAQTNEEISKVDQAISRIDDFLGFMPKMEN